MNIYFSIPKRLSLEIISLTLILSVVFYSTQTFSQLPTSREVVGKMKLGWNMGNTLEAICGETVWGGAYTTQKLIDSVKEAGFNSIRIPCAWYCHSDTATDIIDASWLERVKEVVDYCINDSLYTILNIHWDSGWLENNVNLKRQERVNKRQKAYWTQIAAKFKDYDEHLLFAGSNEPNVENAVQMSVLMTYHQSFIDAVRETGGNNSSRTLIIQGPSTDIEKTKNLMNTLPLDSIDDRLVIEVHYYTPYQFTLMNEDAPWGKMFYYWGNGYHSKTDTERNATWGEEGDVEKYFGWMKTKFIDQGIPVIIGEFGAYRRDLSPPSDQELNSASVVYYNGYVVKSAINHGMVPFYWDINMGLFDRDEGKILDYEVLNSMLVGAGIKDPSGIIEETEGSIPGQFRLEQNYPNPFNPSTTIKYSIPVGANNELPAPTQSGSIVNNVTIKIFDLLGREVAILVNEKQKPGNYAVEFNAAGLGSGIYFNKLTAGNFTKTRKMILIK